MGTGGEETQEDVRDLGRTGGERLVTLEIRGDLGVGEKIRQVRPENRKK